MLRNMSTLYTKPHKALHGIEAERYSALKAAWNSVTLVSVVVVHQFQLETTKKNCLVCAVMQYKFSNRIMANERYFSYIHVLINAVMDFEVITVTRAGNAAFYIFIDNERLLKFFESHTINPPCILSFIYKLVMVVHTP